jgi:hypothetical protein
VTISPIFDQLTSRREAVRPVDRRATPVLASLVAPPLGADDLSAEERAIVADLGGTVARLILQMLDEPAERARR